MEASSIQIGKAVGRADLGGERENFVSVGHPSGRKCLKLGRENLN